MGQIKLLFKFGLLCFLFFLFPSFVVSQGLLAFFKPGNLRCEYLKSPMGIDVLQPRLSWNMVSRRNVYGMRQSAYEILVSSSLDLLKRDEGDLWDSGCVFSDESVNIVYEGRTLRSNQICYWKVRVRDEAGNWSHWSEPSFWRMGLFPDDWDAEWIGSSLMEQQNVAWKPIDNKMQDPWFRKVFVLEEEIQDAMIYVASIGYHELYVNGEKVGNAVLSPSATDHNIRARYMSYDVTRFLNPGKNVIALWLGTSWSIFPAYQRVGEPAIPMALVQAEIAFHENKKMRLVSDETWKVHASPNALIGYWDAHHFGGEFYDAFLEHPGWNTPEFDDSEWMFAKVYRPKVMVSADRTQPNRLLKEIKPLSVRKIRSGTYRVDMGVNYAGWFEMQFAGNPGDTVVFMFSESEKDSITFGIHSIYKIGNTGHGKFCNRFNYMTGRWVQISGLRSEPKLEDIRGWMIRPDYHRAGHFECDIPLLNKIYETALWTFENLSIGNYVVDCPHRERRGYGGDALATTRMALGNYDLGAFYTKWMEDWRDVQQEDGNVPYTAPTMLGGGGPSWSGYCITLPWEMYRQYGDIRILEESFPIIKKWLSFVDTHSENNMLVRWGGKWSFLGDWLWPSSWPERKAMESQGKALGDTRETLFFNNCHWIYSLEIAASIAEILGENQAAIDYRKRSAEIRGTVHTAFYNADDNSYVNGYPAYLAMALMVDLPPLVLREKVWGRLVEEIQVNRKGHFWGGITAGAFLFYTLLDNNYNELIYEMVTKEGFPGWNYMLKCGNGTFFEDWECRGSALHSSYLYVGSWFIEALGGIRRPDAGFKHFVIEPWITPNGPQWVRSEYESLYGNIVSEWKLSEKKLDMRVVVPPNTTAVLELPETYFSSLSVNGDRLEKSDCVEQVAHHEGGFSLFLLSGSYAFSAMRE